MKIRGVFDFIWRYVGQVAAAAFLFLFYGFWGAAAGRYMLDLGEDSSWLFVGFPTGLLVAGIMWKKLPKILGIQD